MTYFIEKNRLSEQKYKAIRPKYFIIKHKTASHQLLTKQEIEVLLYFAQGHELLKIANILHTRVHIVIRNLNSAKNKLNFVYKQQIYDFINVCDLHFLQKYL